MLFMSSLIETQRYGPILRPSPLARSSALFALCASSWVGTAFAADCISSTPYATAGSVTECTVPAGVTSMGIRIVGGGGGVGGAMLNVQGGNGASGTGTISVVPGEILRLTVAGGGKDGLCDGCGDQPGGGGGGASSIVNRTTSTVLVVAGGGGGTGSRKNETDPTIGRGGDAGTGIGGGNGDDGQSGAQGHTGGAGGTRGGIGGAGGNTLAAALDTSILSNGGRGGDAITATNGYSATSDYVPLFAGDEQYGDAGGGGAGVGTAGSGTKGTGIRGSDVLGAGGAAGGGDGGWASGGGGAGYAGGGGGAGSYLDGTHSSRGGGGGGGGSSYGPSTIEFKSVVPDYTLATSAYGEGAYKNDLSSYSSTFKSAGDGVIELSFTLPASAAVAVPSTSTWSLFGLTGLLGACALWCRRRYGWK